jgi:hypothetical protein
MLQAGGSGEVWTAFANAVLLALWPVLPGLLFGYLWQSHAAQCIVTTFTLRKSEAVELDRALAVYAEVCRRIADIGEQPRGIMNFWRELLGRSGSDNADDEYDDLLAHAEHLRATIGRLHRRPLQRLKQWIHVSSAQFALGQALAVYLLAFTLILVALFRISAVSAWAVKFLTAPNSVLVWYPFDVRMFYANAAATALAAAAAPLFYLARRLSLHGERWFELRVFKDLANTDPNRLAEEAEPSATAQCELPAGNCAEDCDWPYVLGLSPDATVGEVKEAYKTLIKQSHPDRVQGMSMAFRRLAEAETKKINVAYRQALAAASSDRLPGMAYSDVAA